MGMSLHTFIYIFLALLTAGAIYVFLRDNLFIEINYYRVPVGAGKLKRAVTLAHLTDLHVSSWISPGLVAGFARHVSDEHPDYIFFTGDFISHFREYIPQLGTVLSGFVPKKRAAGVPGNHDHWLDQEYLNAVLTDSGVEMLRNESFFDEETDLFCAGVDDYMTYHNDLEKSLENRPEGVFTLLLSHSPDIFPEAVKAGVDLILAGHTHGGQVCLPLAGALYVPSEYGTRFAEGWFREHNTRMFVNRGFGGIFPPIRFFCRGEIVFLELVPEEGEPVRIKQVTVRKREEKS